MSLLIPVSGQHTGLYTGPYFSGLSLSRVMNLMMMMMMMMTMIIR